MENSRRNKEISHALLTGQSIRGVGEKYNLSVYSCTKILQNYCWRLDPFFYKSLKSGYKDLSVTTLRENAGIFFNLEKNSKIVSSNSEIWKINGLSNTVIKALLWNDITTIYELSVTSDSVLSKIPMIGKISIKRINMALKTYGFDTESKSNL